MRIPSMEHKASSSRTRAGSNTSLRGRPDLYNEPTSQPHSDREGRSSRASSRTQSGNNSDTSGYTKARKPINEAVTSAFNQATDMNHQSISPDLLNQITSQITANVLQQLKVNQIPAPVAVPSAMPTETADSSSSFGGSPPVDRKVYTPPSPHRISDLPALSPTFSNFSQGSRHQASSPKDKRAPSPFSSGSQNEDSDEKERVARPSAPQRISTSGDATILEKAWGKMYDSEGQYTQRLGQFLRGIAIHIIEDYEPKHSLVITPEKMLKYYEETKLPNECYPWHVIFDDHTSSISRMFREIEVQHHLVQERLHERPDIPGITPQGFETWMKLVLKAQPDIEFDRLAKTALNMPISNPDDKKERFPKQISRRLFPAQPDYAAAVKLEKVLRTHCGVRLPSRNNSIMETDIKPPVTHRTNGASQTSTTLPQRSQTIDPSMAHASGYVGRSSASDTPWQNPSQSSSAVTNQDGSINTKPIERERKPYVAQPGGGKNYDSGDGAPLSKASTVSEVQSVSGPPVGKLERSASMTGRSRTGSMSRGIPPVSVHQKSVQPVDIPEPSFRQRTKSFASDSRSNRNRSPSETRTKDYGHKSEGDIKPSSYQSSSSTDYQTSSYRPERYNQDRYEPRASFSVDPRDKAREQRARFQSTSGGDSSRHYHHDDDHYRPPPGYAGSDGGYSQYPPNAYRTKGS